MADDFELMPNGNGGRPTKRTEEAERAILEGLARGLPLRSAAALAGVSERTLHAWRREDAEWDQAMQQAEALAVSGHLSVIDEAAKAGNWLASRWVLESRYGDLFGKKGPAQAAVQVSIQNVNN